MPSNQRIGHAERDEAVRRLQEHNIDGRLTIEEFEERMERAMQARTYDDLRPLFDDLPDAGWMLGPSPYPNGAYPNGPYSNPVTMPGGASASDLVEVRPASQSAWSRYWWLIPAALVLTLATRGLLGIAVPLVFVWMFWLSPRGGARRPSLYYRRGNLEEQVQVLCRAGRQIEAVKAYREQVPGTSLQQAMAAVDQIAARDPQGY